MKLGKKIIEIMLALLLLISGFAHFIIPEMYYPIIPDFFPKSTVNLLAGGVEILLGFGVFIPSLRKKALLGIFFLMILFLPIHILDALKENPAIGSKTVAIIRIAIQMLLIYLPWYTRKD